MFPLGMRAGGWIIGGMPTIGIKVSGDGGSQPEIGMRLKISYRIGAEYALGIEQYSDLGDTHKNRAAQSAESADVRHRRLQKKGLGRQRWSWSRLERFFRALGG